MVGPAPQSSAAPPGSGAQAASGGSGPPVKPAYPPPAETPTLEGPSGIRFDFNMGARVVLPARTEGDWQVRLRDLDTGNILFESKNKGAFVASAKRFYIRFGVEVFDGDKPVLEHSFDCKGKEVLIQFPVGTLGDTLAWFPYAARFQEIHDCRLTCALSGLIIPLLKDRYPAITFVGSS